MSYYGSQMVVKNYNVMGIAKAALECAVRYIAAELGPSGIRARDLTRTIGNSRRVGIPEFDQLLESSSQSAGAKSGEHRRRQYRHGLSGA